MRTCFAWDRAELLAAVPLATTATAAAAASTARDAAVLRRRELLFTWPHLPSGVAPGGESRNAQRRGQVRLNAVDSHCTAPLSCCRGSERGCDRRWHLGDRAEARRGIRRARRGGGHHRPRARPRDGDRRR